MDTPLVSILTPTYNHRRFIRECIESVLGQSWTNWEQIIIDDGSTDETAAIISEFRDPRIRYFRQENQGIFNIAATYNRALSLSRGGLIAPLEGDDKWPSGKLEAAVPAFADPQVVAAYGICRGVTAENAATDLELPSAEARRLYGAAALRNQPVGSLTAALLHAGITMASATTIVMRRSALEAIGGFQQVPGMPLMDYPTVLALTLAGKFHFVNGTMCYWRAHGQNATSVHRQTVVRGVHRYACEFAEQHARHIQLPRAWMSEIRRRRDKTECLCSFYEGRGLLLAKQWEQARQHFRDAARCGEWRVRAAAACGIAASHLHFDLELLMRAARRAEPAAMVKA